eukprot:TRINITY_DN10688_c0_g1_i4.p1 TRINITY_DN10688_c0_g1~~TRINITY_DN10688_c0_g1_i4.p1  ORF type:complete len:183 (-),score=4.95 TRINITY_DN10688_c0_g1_i4:101-649(-)
MERVTNVGLYSLPYELYLHILVNLDCYSAVMFSRTSKRFSSIITESYWQNLSKLETLSSGTYKSQFLSMFCHHIFKISPSYLRNQWLKFFLARQHYCHECLSNKNPNVWFCLSKNCYHTGCSRYSNQHSLSHWRENKHPIVYRDRLWCYECDTYVEKKSFNIEQIDAVFDAISLTEKKHNSG